MWWSVHSLCSAIHSQSSGLVWFVFSLKCVILYFFGKNKKQPELCFPFHKPWHYFKFYSILRCIFYFFIGLVFKLYQSRKNWPFLMGEQMEPLFRIDILPWSHHFSEKELGLFDFQGFSLVYFHLRISRELFIILMVCSSYKNCHFKNNRTIHGLLFSIAMECIQTGSTHKHFRLDQVGIGVT